MTVPKIDIRKISPLCHGTSTTLLESIAQHGLEPRNSKGCTRHSCYDGKKMVFMRSDGTTTETSLESKSDRVYFGSTASIAQDLSKINHRSFGKCISLGHYANRVAKGGLAILRFHPDKSYEGKLVPDEDAIPDEQDFYGPKRTEFIRRCHEHFSVAKDCVEKKLSCGALDRTARIGIGAKEVGNMSKDNYEQLCVKMPPWAVSLLDEGTVAVKGRVSPKNLCLLQDPYNPETSICTPLSKLKGLG